MLHQNGNKPSPRRHEDKPTTKTVSRSENRISTTPQKKSPEKSSLGRKITTNVIMPALEQVSQQPKKSQSEIDTLSRLEKTFKKLDSMDSEVPLHLIKSVISMISRYPG